MNGDNVSAPGGWDNGFARALAQLKRRNPMAGSILARAASSSKAASPADPDLASSIGAGKDSSGPNGPGTSSPHLAAKPLNVRPQADYSSNRASDFSPYDDVEPQVSDEQLRTHTIQAERDNAKFGSSGNASASFPADIGNAPTSLPSLAPQGGSNKLVRALARLSGAAGPAPEPGQLYTGPQGEARPGTFAGPDQETKGQAIARFVGAIGNAGALAAGTPQQKELAQQRMMFGPQLALERQKLANEAAWRRAMVGINQQKADTGDERAQADKLRTLGQLHAKGMTVDEGGNVRPMTEDEILADPTAAQNQQLHQAAIQSKRAQAALAKAHQDAISNPNSPTFQQRERQIQAQLAMAQQRLDLARTGQDLSQQRFGLQSREEGLKIYQPALDSEERLKVMRQNYVDGLKGDQQAQLSLLANHLGMTMGLQKGARLNQAIVSEAQQSRPWLQGLKAKFVSDGYLTGVTLSPQQMQQMVSLGEDRFRADVSKSRRSASMVGVAGEPEWEVDPDAEPQPLPKSLGELGYNAARNAAPRSFGANGNGSASSPGKPLSVTEARQYLRQAGGDRKKAESMARRDGRTF